jgi:hypothetical protein
MNLQVIKCADRDTKFSGWFYKGSVNFFKIDREALDEFC